MNTRLICAISTLAAALASTPSFAFTRADTVGERADGMSPVVVVVLDQPPRWVNVSWGEVVRFVSAGRSFQWAFTGMGNDVLLADIAPAEFKVPNLRVYVNQQFNPMTQIPSTTD